MSRGDLDFSKIYGGSSYLRGIFGGPKLGVNIPRVRWGLMSYVGVVLLGGGSGPLGNYEIKVDMIQITIS